MSQKFHENKLDNDRVLRSSTNKIQRWMRPLLMRNFNVAASCI